MENKHDERRATDINGIERFVGEDEIKPVKVEVYSDNNCIFNYCPHPDLCKGSEKGCIQL